MHVLHYMDNMMIFLDADTRMVAALRVMLTWFEAESELQVSVSKTKVYYINTVPNHEEILKM